MYATTNNPRSQRAKALYKWMHKIHNRLHFYCWDVGRSIHVTIPQNPWKVKSTDLIKTTKGNKTDTLQSCTLQNQFIPFIISFCTCRNKNIKIIYIWKSSSLCLISLCKIQKLTALQLFTLGELFQCPLERHLWPITRRMIKLWPFESYLNIIVLL